MKQVRLGVIGCGVIGKEHLRVATQSSSIDVVAVADLNQQLAQEVAKKFNVSRVYTDGNQLLNDSSIEAVILAMPVCYRTNLALTAFANGKHVLTEKPVAMNSNEVRQLIQARGNLIAGCCSSRYRFPESANVVTKFIASGELGELRVVQCRVIGAAGESPKKPPPVWRLKKSLNGGGILVNWGCYDLDYLLGITGWMLKPHMVFGRTWKIQPQFESYIAPESDAETHVTAMICCEGGTVITFERGEMVSSRTETENSWNIIGTKGSLHLNMLPGQSKKIIYDRGVPGKGVVPQVLWEGDEDPDSVLYGPVLDFIQAIQDGHQPKTSLEQALIIQKITDAIYASSGRDIAIEINED